MNFSVKLNPFNNENQVCRCVLFYLNDQILNRNLISRFIPIFLMQEPVK